jgi:hypothetical protein
MGRHRAGESDESGESGESGIRQKRLQTHVRHSISRPPAAQRLSLLVQPFNPGASTKRFTPLRTLLVEVSRSFLQYPYTWLAAIWIVLVFTGGVAAVTLFKLAPVEPQQSIAGLPIEQSGIEQSGLPPLSEQLQNPSEQSTPPSGYPENFSETHLEAHLDDADKDSLKTSPEDARDDRSRLSRLEAYSQSEPQEKLPLFALGAVALSCAIGCLWLSYRLAARPPKVQTRLPARTPRLPRASTATQQSARSSTNQSSKAPLPEMRSNDADASTPAVTVILSSQESHPLDWDEPSLADNLDIRQQRPLSYWL